MSETFKTALAIVMLLSPLWAMLVMLLVAEDRQGQPRKWLERLERFLHRD